MFDAGNTIEYHPIEPGAFLEGIQAIVQAARFGKYAVLVNGDITVREFVDIVHLGGLEKIAVLTAEVTRNLGHGNLLRQTRAERVGARDDDAVVDAQFQERVAHGVDFRDEIFVRYGHFAGLVAALLGVRHLVFNLNGTGAGFDHAFREQVGGFFVAETGVDVGNDRNDVGLEIVDLRNHLRDVAAGCARLVQLGEQMPEFAGIRLA